MALPPLTPEQRAAALAKAAEARRIRAEVKNRLKRSGASIGEVIAAGQTDDIIGKMKVSALLESMPGSRQGPRRRDHGAPPDRREPSRARPGHAPDRRAGEGVLRLSARLTVLSGPSGVGKSTVVGAVRAERPDVWLSVSATTRRPRPGETHGVNYFFVDHAEFARMVEHGELLEYAEFAGNFYGTPRTPVLDRLAAGTPVLLEIELQGARQVRASMPEALLVFLAPPSWDELVRRLVGRGTEAADVIARRLETARVELAAESEFDATVVNASVEEAAAALVGLMGLNPS